MVQPFIQLSEELRNAPTKPSLPSLIVRVHLVLVCARHIHAGVDTTFKPEFACIGIVLVSPFFSINNKACKDIDT